MQREQINEQLPNLKGCSCNRIINMFQYRDPNLKDIPSERGNLFLGGVRSFQQQCIKEYKITAVVSILDASTMKRQKIKYKIQQFKLSHLWIDLQDTNNERISQHFTKTYQFISKKLNTHNVLIHCHRGVSRSASIVIAFLMKQLKIGFTEAFIMVRSKRNCIQPNTGFKRQLKQYQKKLFGKEIEWKT